MSTLATSHSPGREAREPVLSTVERVSEMCFGLFMALTFVGAVSVATAGEPDPGRAVMAAALGCNLAWGLVDAVMYLVRTLTERGKRISVALAVRAAADPAAGVRILADSLPPHARGLLSDAELAVVRGRVLAAELPERPRLRKDDFVGAVGIFLIVVASTFPIALPLMVMDDLPLALLVSRLLTLVMLFGGGMALGRFAGFSGWMAGAAMTVLGVCLTVAIIALGG